MLTKITEDLLNSVREQANTSSRKRKNYNFHKDLGDSLQRMLNVMNPGTYVQPHKHEDPDKREAFIVLSGEVAVITFDASGTITDSLILNRDKGNYGVDIEAGIWHTLVVLEKDTVIYEVKDGPYSPIDDKNFASWAPKEGSPECAKYLQKLKDELGV